MDGPVIRSLTEAHASGAAEVAAACLRALAGSPSVRQWGPAMRRRFVLARASAPEHGGGAAEVSLIAEAEGRILGVGSVRRGRRHPHAFMMINVRPGFRRQGVGSALLRALAARARGPFFVREFLSDPDTVGFYRRRGFETGEIATEGMIRPEQAEARAWVLTKREEAPDGVTLMAAGSPGFTATDAARAIDDLYGWIHPHSPPSPLHDDEAAARYLGEARDGGVVIAVRNGDVVGAGVLSTSPFVDDRDVAHLAFCGVRVPETADARAITALLVAHLLAHAGEKGWAVEVEVNSSHQNLLDVVEDIPGADLFRDLIILVTRDGG